jgi:hypothetical protein
MCELFSDERSRVLNVISEAAFMRQDFAVDRPNGGAA